ncbi:uroporphyrinogen decarboxylase family protein [Geosporobacter ferrireducens]|uniref:Methyltransferase n=1 Tax=Geosporobacter ferrireducens TaxID=1424294 RepID=A0A1D8GJC3_9FIRM|nr:uroporphyrinogen decarboxylase family protein [Geosporobacter ferrireducens]AOT70994.1 methyltransferase [Geosporobacter ferrireducens]
MEMNPLFLERLEKVRKTIAFENDSVTTCYMGSATPPAHMDVTMAEYTRDPEKGLDTLLGYVNEINDVAPVDCLNFGYMLKPNVALATAWLSKITMPGRELPENSLWQVLEKKVMQDEDYDLVVEKGYDALFEKVLPQVIDMREFQEFIQYNRENGARDAEKYIDACYPVVTASMISPPFEQLCGARSMGQFYMDCYKKPDKVKAALDVMQPAIVNSAIGIAKAANGIGTWVGGWRGASALVSPKVWDKLVWPYMYDAAMKLIENGIAPIFHLDQNWDRDIERFLELPAKTCILNTDGMTDLRNAKKKLGEHMAFMGDVPSQLLATGKPEEVSEYVKRLLDDIGIKGVFLAPGCDAPANAKFENMVAMFKTAVEYK